MRLRPARHALSRPAAPTRKEDGGEAESDRSERQTLDQAKEEETEGVKEEVKEEQQGHHRRGGRVRSKFNCFGAGMRERTPPP